MAYIFNGSQFDVQEVGTPTVYTYTISGTVATASTGVSTSASVVNGLNIGIPSITGTQPASGVVTFTIPANYNLQAKQFTVVNYGITGAAVKVTGLGTSTINGGTSDLSIAKLTGKTFYNTSGHNWTSF